MYMQNISISLPLLCTSKAAQNHGGSARQTRAVSAAAWARL